MMGSHDPELQFYVRNELQIAERVAKENRDYRARQSGGILFNKFLYKE